MYITILNEDVVVVIARAVKGFLLRLNQSRKLSPSPERISRYSLLARSDQYRVPYGNLDLPDQGWEPLAWYSTYYPFSMPNPRTWPDHIHLLAEV